MGAFPIWVIVLDYALGVVMWTLIGRAAMNLFLPIDSDFFFMKAFVRLTDPVLRLFRPVTPSFLVEPVVPLFVAWFFFMVRFYLMPWLLGLLGDGDAVLPARERHRQRPLHHLRARQLTGASRAPPAGVRAAAPVPAAGSAR